MIIYYILISPWSVDITFLERCGDVEGAKVFNYEDAQGTELLNQLLTCQSPR